jgi:mono/diheme cytochrome c family protein
MAKKSPTLYSVPKTFMWFTIVSFLLTVSLVGIVWVDASREWKDWQKKFLELKLKKAQEDLKKYDQSFDRKKVGELEKALKDAQNVFTAHRSEYERLQKRLNALDAQTAKTKGDLQLNKQFEDSYRYYLEEARLHKEGKKVSSYEARLKKLSPRIVQLKEKQETLDKEREAKVAELAKYKETQETIQKDIEKAREEKHRLKKRVQNLKPSLVKDILNAPMLDFIAPTLVIKQVVLEDLQDDYHFAKVQKVDRCTTCHLGIDQKGFEDAPQPFRTHPKLELYLGSTSPHPLEKVGCTICHGGSGQAVSFVESAHTPNTETQKTEWQKKHKWHALEAWDDKMLPLKHVEASCTKCHSGVVEIPKADKLNKGRSLATQLGCFNCHKIEGYEDRWKVGPDLGHVQSKLSEAWVAKWLDNPKEFRASTKMPRIFHLSNTSSAEDEAKNDAAIQSITAYLMKNSEPVDLTTAPVPGNAQNGEKLVKTLGCVACHSTAGINVAHFAPELSGLGSKVTPEWLYTWLKNPSHYSKDTRMPSLRLSDQEAADITNYLISQRNVAFENKPSVKANPEVVDRMILDSLQGTMRRVEAEASLKSMNEGERMQYLGKKSINQQGCFACHAIKGFEDAKPIGAELSDEGRKDIHKFDFGFIDIEKTRSHWIHQKLKDPRSFDQGKIKAYDEKLRMPQFSLSEEEIESLTTFVLSLTEEQVPLQSQRRLDLRETDIEKGRFLVQKLNCNGCHTLDGKKGLLLEVVEDPGAAPPVLDGEGAKVHEKWLYEFLKSPTPIRPWLTYRMPTFDLDDEELTALVQYFHLLDKQKPPFTGIEIPESSPEKLKAGKALFETFQCIKCHQITQDSAAMGSSFLAPDLTMTARRLKPEWVRGWLRDPQALQEGTMMPTFFADNQSPVTDVLDASAEKQIEAIRDYLYHYETSPQEADSNKDGNKAVAK